MKPGNSQGLCLTRSPPSCLLDYAIIDCPHEESPAPNTDKQLDLTMRGCASLSPLNQAQHRPSHTKMNRRTCGLLSCSECSSNRVKRYSAAYKRCCFQGLRCTDEKLFLFHSQSQESHHNGKKHPNISQFFSAQSERPFLQRDRLSVLIFVCIYKINISHTINICKIEINRNGRL